MEIDPNLAPKSLTAGAIYAESVFPTIFPVDFLLAYVPRNPNI